MSDSDDLGYRNDEHELLMNAAATVLLATVAAERSGPVAYFEEMTAAGTFLYEARRRYPENRLIQELFRQQEIQEVAPLEKSGGQESEHGSELSKESLTREIERVNTLLRVDAEGMEFREFLFALAERVAKAARSGWFGPRVSSEEQAFLDELKRKLGLDDRGA